MLAELAITLRKVWPWLLLAAVVLLVLAVVVWLWWRRRKARPPVTPPAPLKHVWERFLKSLPPELRGRPVALVIGPARSGKTALITEGRVGPTMETSVTDDARIGLYAADRWLVQELSADVIDDARRGGVSARRALLRASAWQTSVVVLTVDLGAATATPSGLGALGRRVRVALDELASRRASPVRVRLCITHLDQRLPGFVAFLTGAHAVRHGSRRADPAPRLLEAPLRPTGMSPAALRESLGRLDVYLKAGLRTAAFGHVVHFAATATDTLLEPLAPLLGALFGLGRSPAPVLDGVYLAAYPPGAPPSLLGDPFALSLPLFDDLARERRRVRVRKALWAAFAVACLLLVASVPRVMTLQREADARDAVAVFVDETVKPRETRNAPPGAAPVFSPEVESRALAAGRELRASTPPGVRPDLDFDKGRYLDAVRKYYLTPTARRPELASRTAALALLHASRGSPLHAALRSQIPAIAARTGVPDRVLRDYLALVPDERPVNPLGVELTPLAGATPPELQRFFRMLAEAQASPKVERLVEVRAEAQRQRRLVANSDPDPLSRTLIAELSHHGLPVERWLGTTSTRDAAMLGQVRAVLDAVGSAALEIPPARGQVLGQVVRALDQIAVENPSAMAEPQVIEIAGERHVFDAQRWSSTVTTSRASRYLDGWVASLTPQARDAFVPSNACVQALGGSTFAGLGPSSGLPCVYGSDIDQDWVRAPKTGLAAALQRARVAPEVAQRAAMAVTRREIDYGGERRGALERYYAGYSFACTSPEVLASNVAAMTAPRSFFATFLTTFAQNASSGGAPVPADLRAVAALGTAQDGKLEALEAYYALLAPLLPQLSSVRPPGAPAAPLAQRIAPIGALGLLMLNGGDTSPRVRVTRWLDTQQVPERYRRPFLAPVDCAYRLGVAEVEQVIAAAWQQEILAPAMRVWVQFPFERASEIDASPAEVEAVFNPHGTFWTGVDAVLSPVLVSVADGVWRPRVGVGGRSIALPRGVLPALSRAHRIRSALFTAEGQAHGIALTLRTEALPPGSHGAVPILASLQVGTQSVLAFNQTPSWQTLSLPWSEESTAGLTVRTTPAGGGPEQYHSLERGPSPWSFYRLLTTGALAYVRPAPTRVTWTVAGAGEETFPVRFQVRGDPWAPFTHGGSGDGP